MEGKNIHNKNDIVFVSIDLIANIANNRAYTQRYKEYLYSELEDKIDIYKTKIIQAYQIAKIHHPDSLIIIFTKECAIGQGIGVNVSENILSEEEKDIVIKELSSLTIGRDIILVPGSLAYTEKEPTEEGKEVICNRTYVLSQGKICGYQDKKSALFDIEKEFRDLYFVNNNSQDKVITVFNKNKEITISIDICRDHNLSTKKFLTDEIKSDIYFVLSNSTYFEPNKAKGKFNLHCDGSRPTKYFVENDNFVHPVYSTSLLAEEKKLYKVENIKSHSWNPGFFLSNESCDTKQIKLSFEDVYDDKKSIGIDENKNLDFSF